MPTRMPQNMPDRIAEDMPDKMPEGISDRMPEGLPITKYIHIMVGIIRNEIIIYIFFFQIFSI